MVHSGHEPQLPFFGCRQTDPEGEECPSGSRASAGSVRGLRCLLAHTTGTASLGQENASIQEAAVLCGILQLACRCITTDRQQRAAGRLANEAMLISQCLRQRFDGPRVPRRPERLGCLCSYHPLRIVERIRERQRAGRIRDLPDALGRPGAHSLF